jgi:hypothetical protein
MGSADGNGEQTEPADTGQPQADGYGREPSSEGYWTDGDMPTTTIRVEGIRMMPKDEWMRVERDLLKALGVPENEWPPELREKAPEQQNGTGKAEAAADKAVGQPDAVKEAEAAAKAEADKAEAEKTAAASDETPAAAEQQEQPEATRTETAAEAAANAIPAEEQAPATDTGKANTPDLPDNIPPPPAANSGLDTADGKGSHTEVGTMAEGAAGGDTPEAAKTDRFAELIGDGVDGMDDERDGRDELEEPPELGRMMLPTPQPGAVAVQNLGQPRQGWQEPGTVPSGERPSADQPAPAYTPTEWSPPTELDPRTEVNVAAGAVAVEQASEHPVTLTGTLDGTVVATAWSEASQVDAMASISAAEGGITEATRQALREAVDASPALQTDDLQVAVFSSTQPANAADPNQPATGQALDAARDAFSSGGSPTRDIKRLGEHDLQEGSEVRMDVATGRVTAVGPTGDTTFTIGGAEGSDASPDDTAGDAADDGGGSDE